MMFPSPKTVRYKWRWVVAALAAVLVAAAAGIAWAEYHRRAERPRPGAARYPEARDHLICYLRIWPRSAAAHVGLARCAGGLGADDEARRFLARARELGESWEGVALEEFLLDAQRGTLSPEGVHLLWDRVERGDPETPRILEALVLGHLSTYQLSVAAIFAERWVEQSPRNAQAVYLRGLVRQGLGDVARAGEDFALSSRSTPNMTRRISAWPSTCLRPATSGGQPNCSRNCSPASPRLRPSCWDWPAAGDYRHERTRRNNYLSHSSPARALSWPSWLNGRTWLGRAMT